MVSQLTPQNTVRSDGDEELDKDRKDFRSRQAAAVEKLKKKHRKWQKAIKDKTEKQNDMTPMKHKLEDTDIFCSKLTADECTNLHKVFTVFVNSFEKSSLHWQARDEYQGDIKQGCQQTTAELDIHIKDLVRRCQFKTKDVESCKVDLLYHATVHFEVRKFVHNAKSGELTYDKIIEIAKTWISAA